MASASPIPGVDLARVRTVAVSPDGADAAASQVFDVILDATEILGAWAPR
jgi:hypothetical protein